VQQLRQEAASYRTKLREYEQQQAEMTTAQKAAKEKELAEQQKWQTLAEQRAQELEALTPYKQRYEAMIENVAATNAKRIEAVPETMRTLIPEYEDPLKLAGWLDANADKLTKPTAPNLDSGAGKQNRNGATPSVTLQQAQELAAVYGVDPRLMAAQLGIGA
jgi:ATPase subunit of ABC transporter with duplicated ATPase domains